MKPSEDYPRMMFHRSKEPVVILSREEEDGLGPEWSRIVWAAQPFAEPEPAPAPEPPEPPTAGYAEAEPEEEHAPTTPLRRLARALTKSPPKSAKPAKKRR